MNVEIEVFCKLQIIHSASHDQYCFCTAVGHVPVCARATKGHPHSAWFQSPLLPALPNKLEAG